MHEKLETKKYVFTVEGETEQWYLEWLGDQINKCETRKYNVAVDAKVQQSPKKYYKTINAKTVPRVFHICDMESNEPVHVDKFKNILAEMKDANTQKKITYRLGYSNFAFELWIVLHKRNCNGPLSDRKQYLHPINRAYGEKFENLDQYKHEDNFKRCLKKLSLDEVREAINRADVIMKNNEKDHKKLLQHKGYIYYQDNPALTVHEVVRMMFDECGIL